MTIVSEMTRGAATDPKNDAEVVRAWLDSHHDDVADAVSLTSSPVRAITNLLMGQPEFVDWDKNRIEDAVMYDEEDQMTKMNTMQEMPAHEIVGWIGDGYALCPQHVTDEKAERKGMQPIFASSDSWEDIGCDAHDDDPHTLGDTAGISEDMTMRTGSKSTGLALEALIAEAVKKGIAKAFTETKKPKTRKITRSQLAEGVRKALRMALKESGMSGGVMPAPGMGAGAPMSAPTQEGLSDGDVTKKGSMTGGNVPSPEELQAALDEIGGWSMDLKGADYFAFEYAMLVSGLGNPNMDTGEGMHAVLTALTNTPSPEELPHDMDDEEISDPHSQLNKLLNAWDVRYGRSGEKIEDHAQSLASIIVDALGWEWV